MSDAAKLVRLDEVVELKTSEDVRRAGARYLASLPAGEPAKFTVQGRVLHEGTFDSVSAGRVQVDRDLLKDLVENFNASLVKGSRGIVIQTDHSDRARDTVGVVSKPMRLVEELIDGKRVAAIHADLDILGVDAITRVLDGRLHNLSAGFSIKDRRWVELTFTPFPACPAASTLLRDGVPADSVMLKKSEHTALLEELAKFRERLAAREARDVLFAPARERREAEETARLAAESAERRAKFKREARIALKSPHARPLGYTRWE